MTKANDSVIQIPDLEGQIHMLIQHRNIVIRKNQPFPVSQRISRSLIHAKRQKRFGFVIRTMQALSLVLTVFHSRGLNGNTPVAHVMPRSIHIVIHITVSTLAGVGSVALLRAGGFGYNRIIGVGMSAFPDCQIVHSAGSYRMAFHAHIGQHKVLAADPIGGLVLRSTSDEVTVHGADFFAIHIQPNHVASISGNAVFQTECMRLIIQRRQIDTIVIILCAVPCAEAQLTALCAG